MNLTGDKLQACVKIIEAPPNTEYIMVTSS